MLTYIIVLGLALLTVLFLAVTTLIVMGVVRTLKDVDSNAK